MNLVYDLSSYLWKKENMNTFIDKLNNIRIFNHQTMATKKNEIINNTSLIEGMRDYQSQIPNFQQM
jgi:hypothetical protein